MWAGCKSQPEPHKEQLRLCKDDTNHPAVSPTGNDLLIPLTELARARARRIACGSTKSELDARLLQALLIEDERWTIGRSGVVAHGIWP